MIRVERPSEPDSFGPRHEKLREEVASFFYGQVFEKRQQMFEWRKYRISNEFKDVLLNAFRGKCAYCETPLDEKTMGDLEHFRPRSGARGLDTFHDRLYWWLAFEWTNLLVACPTCNRHKASWFPIADEVSRATEPDSGGPTIDDEQPLFLDPCSDDPGRHLVFDADGFVSGTTERGSATVQMLELNRKELVQRRFEALTETGSMYDGFVADQSNWASVEHLIEVADLAKGRLPYLAIRRQELARRMAEDDAVAKMIRGVLDAQNVMQAAYEEGLFEASAPPEDEGHPAVAPLDLGRIAIERIHIKNFRNIVDLTLEMPPTSDDGRTPWLVFLGENGVGKSSIMQAIVLTLMGAAHRGELPGLTPTDVLRYERDDEGNIVQMDEGSVSIEISGRDPLELRFFRDVDTFDGTVASPATYLLAYGSTRLLPDDDFEAYDSEGRVRVRNLFRPSAPLVDVTKWLLELHLENEERFDYVVRGLRHLLLMKEHETIRPDHEKGCVWIEFKNELSTIDKLSDGYRTIVALASDMMYMLGREGTSMEEANGVVVIDEIGTNLHPGWKKRIVDRFRDVFPRVQVLATTHEPLCLRGLHEGETILLRRTDDGVAPITTLPNPNDLRVDELLASEFFGLSTTLESDLEEIYQEYYALLTKESRTADERTRMEELKGQLREREHLGNGLRDELMYEVIDKLIAKQLRSKEPKTRPALKKEALQAVLESWKEAGLVAEGEA